MDRFEREKDRFVDHDRDAGLATDRIARRRSGGHASGRAARDVYVIFLLGLAAHRKEYPPDTAADIYRRSTRFVQNIRSDLKRHGATAVLEVHEFDSFAELIRARPKVKGRKWTHVWIVTHGKVIFTSDVAGSGTTGSLLGDRDHYDSHPDPDHVIHSAINGAPAGVIMGFQGSFDRRADLTIVACGVGSTETVVAEFMRDFFGIDGAAKMPTVPVNFDRRTGRLGRIREGDTNTLEALEPSDWATIPAR